MAAYPATYPSGGGVPRDWSTEIAPGFAYGGAGSMSGMNSNASGGMSGGANSGAAGSISGGANSGAAANAQTRPAAPGAAQSGPANSGAAGGMSGGANSGAAWGGAANSGQPAGGMSGGANSGAAWGGAANSGQPAGGGTAVSGGMPGGAESDGTAVGSGTTVRAGWYPGGGYMDIIGKDIENNLPPSEIGVPDSLEEVFRGSMKALLLRNIGNYVVATFLIGTQGTVSWEGILYDVGNDYLAIYQTGRDQYIVSDLYSLKYVEFYDTRRREMCEAMMNGQTTS